MAKRISVATTPWEQDFLHRVKKFPDRVITAHNDSIQEGFEYLESEEYLRRYSKNKSLIKDKFQSIGFKNIPKLIGISARYIPPMMRGRKECFTDLHPYLEEIESAAEKTGNSLDPLLETYPNEELWQELKAYAWDRWRVIIGFTELPNQLIFKGKAVLFKYVIVCIQEMDKEKIELAPTLEAGKEVFKVYNTLGKNGIRCQSNHPLGGLVNTPPLAAKAGMGWQGDNGLLITPQFGQRQRIAPIFIEDKLFQFTDNHNHLWIEEFCSRCKKCQKACPTQAIYSERKPGIQNIPGITQTKTCIDRIKCFPEFSKTLGCSICIKVCPFSQGEKSYDKIRNAFQKKIRKDKNL